MSGLRVGKSQRPSRPGVGRPLRPDVHPRSQAPTSKELLLPREAFALLVADLPPVVGGDPLHGQLQVFLLLGHELPVLLRLSIYNFRGENSLAVQWLGLHSSLCPGPGFNPAQGTEIPQDTWHSQKKKCFNKKFIKF